MVVTTSGENKFSVHKRFMILLKKNNIFNNFFFLLILDTSMQKSHNPLSDSNFPSSAFYSFL